MTLYVVRVRAAEGDGKKQYIGRIGRGALAGERKRGGQWEEGTFKLRMPMPTPVTGAPSSSPSRGRFMSSSSSPTSSSLLVLFVFPSPSSLPIRTPCAGAHPAARGQGPACRQFSAQEKEAAAVFEPLTSQATSCDAKSMLTKEGEGGG